MSIQGEIKDGKLILTIDVDHDTLQDASPSKSGKTLLVATTGGFTRFGAFGVSLNVTAPLPKAVAAPVAPSKLIVKAA
jgi:hypothetical protein